MPPLLLSSGLKRKISDRISAPFNIMTTFYFRRSVEKAFQLDEQPSDLSLNLNKQILSSVPHVTSAVDDVMYIVNQVVQRSLATSQPDIIASVLPTVARVLGSDFVGMIQRKLRDESYPKAAIQGNLPPEHLIIAFMVLLNNLDVSAGYIKRIIHSQLHSPPNPSPTKGNEAPARNLADLYPFGHDVMLVTSALGSLQSSFEAKTSELISDGIYVIFKNVMKPRLRPILADSFRDIDYSMTEEDIEDLAEQAEGENNPETITEGAVQQRFQRGWEGLTKPIARIFTDGNYERLLGVIISYLSEVLEKRIWSHYGRINRLGAVRLERDIAGIVATVVRGGRYALRDAFARCTQICLVMNMEDDEWEELQATQKSASDDGIEWKLDTDERGRAKIMVREPQ